MSLPVHQGLDEKAGWWSAYIIINMLGFALCCVTLAALARLKDRNSGDYFVGGLCLACISLSGPCFVQCILNAAHDHFAYGIDACTVQAISHGVSAVTEVLCVALIAIRSYLIVVHGRTISPRDGLIIVTIGLALATLITVATALLSEVVLMVSGLWCFFGVGAPVKTLWLFPFVGICVFIVVFAYSGVFWHTRKVLRRGRYLRRWHSSLTSSDGLGTSERLARKTFIFAVSFMLCWMPTFLAIFFQNPETGGTPLELDIVITLGASFHSVVAPILYGYFNPRIQVTVLDMLGLSRFRARMSRSSSGGGSSAASVSRVSVPGSRAPTAAGTERSILMFSPRSPLGAAPLPASTVTTPRLGFMAPTSPQPLKPQASSLPEQQEQQQPEEAAV